MLKTPNRSTAQTPYLLPVRRPATASLPAADDAAVLVAVTATALTIVITSLMGGHTTPTATATIRRSPTRPASDAKHCFPRCNDGHIILLLHSTRIALCNSVVRVLCSNAVSTTARCLA